MKRSAVNLVIRLAQHLFDESNINTVPAVDAITPSDWGLIAGEPELRARYARIAEGMIGFDVTTLGSQDFFKQGLFLFTTANGVVGDLGETYAEKKMIVGPGQVTPTHYHWDKTEDIVNLSPVGSGRQLVIEVWLAHSMDYSRPRDEAARVPGRLANERFWIPKDSMQRGVNGQLYDPGSTIVLDPHERVRLYGVQGGEAGNDGPIYHKFYGSTSGGPVLVGEVSKVNDDVRDNRFLEPLERFSGIEPDEPAYRLLCNEVAALLSDAPVHAEKRAEVEALVRMGTVPGQRLDDTLLGIGAIRARGQASIDCYEILRDYLAN
ncbi:MAG: D-lyxose/D-mannose family sugar isomerase [archaeon]